MADAIQLVDEDTWLLVDLDNTLFEAKQALGHVNWFYDEIEERMQKGMSREDSIKEGYIGWVKTQRVCSVQPLEVDFVPALISLQNRGVVIMGLTHRWPIVAESTAIQVESLGLDFTKTAPSKGSFVVPAANQALYLRGILFAHDYNKKGDVFLSFLSEIQKMPTKILFIDDKKSNVEELEKTMSKYDVEYIGVYYTAYKYVKPVYSRELAKFQSKFLDTILSNEVASLLMEQGLE